MSKYATELPPGVSTQQTNATASVLLPDAGGVRRLSKAQELAVLTDLEAKCARSGIDLDEYASVLLALRGK